MDEELQQMRVNVTLAIQRLRKATDAWAGQNVTSDDPKEETMLALCQIVASQQRLIGKLIGRYEQMSVGTVLEPRNFTPSLVSLARICQFAG